MVTFPFTNGSSITIDESTIEKVGIDELNDYVGFWIRTYDCDYAIGFTLFHHDEIIHYHP